jgi:FMN-dependent NADH-azoreductase
LLYIRCNLKARENSRSRTLAGAFLDEYRRLHPDDKVETVDLYRDDIPRIDEDIFSGWGSLRSGAAFRSLNPTQQRKLSRLSELADQFVSADKYVFATPMWNLGLPAEMKMYIDAVCVVGKAFKYTPQGPIGLFKGLAKKCLHLHSSGGFHFGKTEDHSVPYLRDIMNFVGVEHFQAIVLEGVDAFPERAEELKSKAVEEAIAAAASF